MFSRWFSGRSAQVGWVAIGLIVFLAPQPEAMGQDTSPGVPTESNAESMPAEKSADPPAVKEPESSPSRGEKAESKKGKKKKPISSIEIGGRVFVRDTITRPGGSDEWFHDLSVDSARIGVEYKRRDIDLEIEMEAELAGRQAEIRDGYVRISPTRYLRVQAGRFKRPISAIALASRWSLPVLERGIASDLEQVNATTAVPDRLPLGGRTTGLAVRLRARSLPWDPRVTVGVFRGEANRQLAEASTAENRAVVAISEEFPEDLNARLEVEPAEDIRVGASIGWFAYLGQAGTRDTFTHGLVGGVDIVLERKPVRVWAEAHAGTSPIHLRTALQAEGRFVAVRAIASARFALPIGPDLYIEPYASGQVLDASSDTDDDLAWEIAGGANVGLSDIVRLQIGVRHIDVARRLFGDATSVIVQLGAVF